MSELTKNFKLMEMVSACIKLLELLKKFDMDSYCYKNYSGDVIFAPEFSPRQ